MFAAEFNSEDVFVLNDSWDGSKPLQCVFSLTRDDVAGLTQRAARRGYSQTLLCTLSFETVLRDEELLQVQNCLRDLTTESVIVPFWPAILKWADRATAQISGGLKVAWLSDWSDFAIWTDVEPAGPFDFIAPALMGYLKATSPSMLTATSATWEVRFQESSPAAYALKLSGDAFAAGPQPVGYAAAPKLLPVQPDFSSVLEGISFEMRRERVGFRREEDVTFYPHAASRTQEAAYTFAGGSVASFLRFFQEIAGPGSAFWAPSWLQVAELTAAALAVDTVLNVAVGHAVRVGDYLALYRRGVVIACKATAKTANTITLDVAPGVAIAPADTLILPLNLVRLVRPSITAEWKRPGLASCTMQVREMPYEVTVPGDETLGTTIGRLPTRVILFHFTREIGNGTALDYFFTNFEADLEYDGETWVSSSFDCGDITQSLNVENDVVEIVSMKFDGNPLIEDITRRAEAPLRVAILFADLVAGVVENPQVVFTGDATTSSRRGNRLTVRCNMGPGIFRTKLPIFLRGTMCNHLRGSNADGSFLISAGCTLLRADWKFTATVAAPISAAFPYTVHLAGLARAVGAAPTYFANWFAGGVIEWGAGANLQRRAILANTNPAGGALDVTLHRYFSSVPLIGDAVSLYPGCDGLYTTCKAYAVDTNPTGKFNNYLNFGGEPFTPAGNPSVVGQANLGTQGGKK